MGCGAVTSMQEPLGQEQFKFIERGIRQERACIWRKGDPSTVLQAYLNACDFSYTIDEGNLALLKQLRQKMCQNAAPQLG